VTKIISLKQSLGRGIFDRDYICALTRILHILRIQFFIAAESQPGVVGLHPATRVPGASILKPALATQAPQCAVSPRTTASVVSAFPLQPSAAANLTDQGVSLRAAASMISGPRRFGPVATDLGSCVIHLGAAALAVVPLPLHRSVTARLFLRVEVQGAAAPRLLALERQLVVTANVGPRVVSSAVPFR